MRCVVEDAPRRADAGISALTWRPDHTEPRSKLRNLAEGRAVAGISLITRKDETRWGLRIYLTMHALIEQRLIEVAHPAVGVLHRQERLPSDAEIDRDVAADAPVVLAVRADVIVVIVVVDRIALNDATTQRSDHEVGKWQSCPLPVERELAV